MASTAEGERVSPARPSSASSTASASSCAATSRTTRVSGAFPRVSGACGPSTTTGSSPVAFFPDESHWPVLTALGFALAATGVVFGLWLFLIGLGVLALGVFGMVFQYAHR